LIFENPHWLGYLAAIGASLICTGLGVAMSPRFDIVNIAMIYLLAVVLIALTSPRARRFSARFSACCSSIWFLFLRAEP
jgi:K+-sensing histidine kinase KdpD